MPSNLGTRSRLPRSATPANSPVCFLTLPYLPHSVPRSRLKAWARSWGQEGHLEQWQCRQGHSRCCTGRWQHRQHLQQRAGAAQGAHWPARAAPPTCQARHGSAAQSPPQRLKNQNQPCATNRELMQNHGTLQFPRSWHV